MRNLSPHTWRGMHPPLTLDNQCVPTHPTTSTRSGASSERTRFKLKALCVSFSQSKFKTRCFQAGVELAPPRVNSILRNASRTFGLVCATCLSPPRLHPTFAPRQALSWYCQGRSGVAQPLTRESFAHNLCVPPCPPRFSCVGAISPLCRDVVLAFKRWGGGGAS